MGWYGEYRWKRKGEEKALLSSSGIDVVRREEADSTEENEITEGMKNALKAINISSYETVSYLTREIFYKGWLPLYKYIFAVAYKPG